MLYNVCANTLQTDRNKPPIVGFHHDEHKEISHSFVDLYRVSLSVRTFSDTNHWQYFHFDLIWYSYDTLWIIAVPRRIENQSTCLPKFVAATVAVTVCQEVPSLSTMHIMEAVVDNISIRVTCTQYISLITFCYVVVLKNKRLNSSR